jgi:hypothetical protein
VLQVTDRPQGVIHSHLEPLRKEGAWVLHYPPPCPLAFAAVVRVPGEFAFPLKHLCESQQVFVDGQSANEKV